MRLFTLDQAVQLTSEVFDDYVEPVGTSLMSGEVPSIMFTIHRTGTKEKDWLAQVRFKNTLAISVFRCDVYLDDVFRLCRKCKLWLLTDEVFQIVVLYAMLHPLYQSQYVDFKIDVNADYDSMMASAGNATYSFIYNYYKFTDPVQKEVLLVLKCFMAQFTNHVEHIPNLKEIWKQAEKNYEKTMFEKYPGAYWIARYRPAQTYLIDEEGYILLERNTKGGIHYTDDEKDETK